jgi:hypothetical protein
MKATPGNNNSLALGIVIILFCGAITILFLMVASGNGNKPKPTDPNDLGWKVVQKEPEFNNLIQHWIVVFSTVTNADAGACHTAFYPANSGGYISCELIHPGSHVHVVMAPAEVHDAVYFVTEVRR